VPVSRGNPADRSEELFPRGSSCDGLVDLAHNLVQADEPPDLALVCLLPGDIPEDARELAWPRPVSDNLEVLAELGTAALKAKRFSRDRHLTMEPHGLDGRVAFALVTAGTLLLALGGLVFGIVLHR